jgi:hypothetical protein
MPRGRFCRSDSSTPSADDSQAEHLVNQRQQPALCTYHSERPPQRRRKDNRTKGCEQRQDAGCVSLAHVTKYVTRNGATRPNTNPTVLTIELMASCEQVGGHRLRSTSVQGSSQPGDAANKDSIISNWNRPVVPTAPRLTKQDPGYSQSSGV